MTSLADRVLARPRLTLAAWFVAIGLLALVGTGLSGQVKPASLSVPGSQSARFDALDRAHFGPTLAVPVLLEGPPSQIDAQGPALAAALARVPHTHVLSPWTARAAKRLRPTRTSALVAVSIDLPQGTALKNALHRVEQLAHQRIKFPVSAYVTGSGPLAKELNDTSFSALHSRERIALIVLALVLLLVLGSPVAAAIPAVAGAAAVAAGYGLITIVGHFVHLDDMTVAVASMMGLALGVDYALLMVARYREERAARGDGAAATREAVLAAANAAGRTILLTGSMLIAAMIAATAVLSGGLLVSAAVGVILVAIVSVASSLVAVPAAIFLLSGAIERWRIPRPRIAGLSASGLTAAVLRRPALVAIGVGTALLALALPATGLRTGAPDARQLPSSSRARIDFEASRRVVGPGYASPFEVVAVAKDGAITTSARLHAMRTWQRRVARDPDVALVIGPGDLAAGAARTSARMRRASTAAPALRRGRRALARLTNNVGQAGAGVRDLRSGAARAGSAARRLAAGSAAGLAGAGRVHSGVGSATAGVKSLRDGIASARTGAQQLAASAGRPADALRGVDTRLQKAARQLDALAPQAHASSQELSMLQGGVGKLSGNVGNAAAALREASSALGGVRTWDPRVGKAKSAIDRALAQLGTTYDGLSRVKAGVDDAYARSQRVATAAGDATSQLGTLRSLAATLASHLAQLRDGNSRLAAGLSRVLGGSDGLADALRRLAAGAAQLDNGLGGLRTGAATIAASLAQSQARSQNLETSLRAADGSVAGVSAQLTGTRHGSSAAASLADSPYLTLAALDQARAGTRAAIAAVVNLDRGGTAGHFIVVPRSAPNTPQTAALARRLDVAGRDLAAATGTQVAVGGPAATLNDYAHATARHLWLVIAALTIVTFLLLAAVFRSALLAGVVVGINLVTVAAAFGGLAILFQGSAPLGGPGYLDATAATAILTIMFGLSIDYQVFLLARIREGRASATDARAAVQDGLRRTAHVIAGAALIMTAVFVTFAQSDVVNVRQFGTGMAIAVVLDATVVRLVLLPAVITLLGDRCWPRTRRAPEPARVTAPAPAPARPRPRTRAVPSAAEAR